MTLDFPSSPSDGQVYSAPNGVSYVYDFTNGYWIVQSESVAISDGSVTTSKIADGAVTPVKLDRTYVEPPIGGSVVGYQRGIWTPVFGCTNNNLAVTYAIQQGEWTRIGQQITITYFIQITDKTAGNGNLMLSQLPFGVSEMPARATGPCYGAQFNNLNPTFALCTQKTYDCRFYTYATGNNFQSTSVPALNLKSSSSVIGSITYITDDTTFVPQNGATVS